MLFGRTSLTGTLDSRRGRCLGFEEGCRVENQQIDWVTGGHADAIRDEGEGIGVDHSPQHVRLSTT